MRNASYERGINVGYLASPMKLRSRVHNAYIYIYIYISVGERKDGN